MILAPWSSATLFVQYLSTSFARFHLRLDLESDDVAVGLDAMNLTDFNEANNLALLPAWRTSCRGVQGGNERGTTLVRNCKVASAVWSRVFDGITLINVFARRRSALTTRVYLVVLDFLRLSDSVYLVVLLSLSLSSLSSNYPNGGARLHPLDWAKQRHLSSSSPERQKLIDVSRRRDTGVQVEDQSPGLLRSFVQCVSSRGEK